MKKKFIYTMVLLLVLLSFSACAKKDEVTELKLSEVTRSVFYTPLYVAINHGFFEEENLAVDLQTAWGGDKAMTALLSNQADIALIGSETSVYVYAQDAADKVINFAQLTKRDGTFLVGKNKADNFVWTDIKGSDFLGQRKGGMPQMVGEFVLKKNDIDPFADLNLTQNIDFANIPTAFATGDYEFVQLFEPTASMIENEGKGHVIASFGEQSGLIPYTVFMAKDSFLNEQTDTAKAFTQAIYNAQKWVQETDSKEIAKVVQPFFEDSDLDILATSIERYKEIDAFATDPLLQEDAWNNLQDVMEEAGELPKAAPYEELVNTNIAKEVIAKD